MPVKPKSFRAGQLAKCSAPGDWDDDAFFEVEDVVGTPPLGKQLQYKKNGKDTTLLIREPVSNIVHCVNLINDYEAVHTCLTDQHIRAQRVAPGKMRHALKKLLKLRLKKRRFRIVRLPRFRHTLLPWRYPLFLPLSCICRSSCWFASSRIKGAYNR